MRKIQVHLARDTVLFIVGILGIINEAVLQHADRPTLLILFGAMVGLPAFLRQDEKVTTAIKAKPRANPRRVTK